MSGVLRLLGRLVLATLLLVAGVAHFAATEEFLGQVPTFLAFREEIVLVSGAVELALGLALLVTRGSTLATVGWAVAAFFVLVFPGNVWQLINASTSFGLESDTSRIVRLFFQPLLIALAIWATGPRRGEDRRLARP